VDRSRGVRVELSERYSAQITVVRALLIVIAMKASPRMLVLAWTALSVVAGGCGGVTLQPSDGGATAGHGGSSGGQSGSAGVGGTGGTPCGALDETTCKTRLDCTAQYCHACPNQSQFEGCTTVGAPPMECAEECVEVSCDSLDEASCKARRDCQPDYCQGCGGAQTFVGCGAPGGGTACPAIACVPPPCSGLDEASCTARSDCHAESCPNCDGGVGFAGCIAPGDPQVQCPAACIGEPPCNQLSESQCTTRGDCAPGYCPNCSGGQRFVGCAAPGTAFSCPLTCPAPSSCSTVTTEAACDERNDCHSVFAESPACDCATAGCCAHFSQCADGGKASCTGPASCNIVGPYCDGTAYVVSYTATCYEGCVRPSECGP
jgi:hypothetical protein